MTFKLRRRSWAGGMGSAQDAEEHSGSEAGRHAGQTASSKMGTLWAQPASARCSGQGGPSEGALRDTKRRPRKVLGPLWPLGRSHLPSWFLPHPFCPTLGVSSRGSPRPMLRNCWNSGRLDFIFSSPCLLEMGALSWRGDAVCPEGWQIKGP